MEEERLICNICHAIIHDENGNFCSDCGCPLEKEEGLIRHYFRIGYEYEEILRFLASKHGMKMSLRTLKNRLREYGLRRKNYQEDEGQVRQTIEAELDGPGNSRGYRSMWHCLKIDHNVQTQRATVERVLRDVDPEGTERRKRHQFRRRQYINPGPDWCWHVDGHDKLKPYGFPIHGCIDGYSRKIMWLKVGRTNNDPHVIAHHFLECVKQYAACPRLLRTDCGTENGVMAAIQCYFRQGFDDEYSGINSHRYGTSTSNQRIENWWSFYSRGKGHWWRNFFKDLVDRGIVQTGSEMHMECLWFCFSRVLEIDLDQVKEHWNTHRIRQSRHETIGGRPDALYFLSGENFKSPVSENIVADMEQYCSEPINESFFTEYFQYTMENCNLNYPTYWRDALQLYHTLLEIAQG